MNKRYKKIMVSLMATSIVLNLGVSMPIIAGPVEPPFNYAEAFQKSMYFYDANKCGPGVGEGELTWRGDCHTEDKFVPLVPKDDVTGMGTNLSASFIKQNKEALDPDGDGTVDLSGGFHDAGDHVKFGLPQSYSGSTLGWGYYEFKDSYVAIGEKEHIESILRGFNDYFMRCTFKNSEGEVVAFAYQVGDGTTDHNYWGPPELQKTARPAFFASAETPASDQCAGAAASLAINYLNFKDSDPVYAEKCLETAEALYEFAKENRGLGFSGGFYNSSYDEDEMSWAAVWLSIATGDKSYVTDITAVDENGAYTGYMSRIISTTSSTWQNIWVHSWDTVWGGVFAKLAPLTNNPEHWYFFRWNIEYWSGVPHENPNDTTYMASTPAGYKVVSTWGSARYETTAQLCALVYNKYKANGDFTKWCKSQMDYLLGDNPMNRCYEVGYSDISAIYPHHRAAHGSLTNSMLEPAVERHTLWGALVGGPDGDDYHKDDITDYVYNEVAIDYNAGFVGALAGLYELYGKGQAPLENFPPQEKDERPFYATAKIEQENSERSQITVKIHNDTSCPPSFESGLKARYFFDISEMVEAGQSLKELSVQVMYDQASIVDGVKTNINGPFMWDEEKNIAYIELDWSQNSFHGNREIHFGLVPTQDSQYKVHWDFTNDWSHEGLTKVEALTEYVSVYLDGEKVFGKEPTSYNVSINTPVEGSTISYIEGEKPITLEAIVGAAEESVTSIAYYADGIQIGEVQNAPYTFEYVADNISNVEQRQIAFSAKAHLANGTTITSKPVTITVVYRMPEALVVKLIEPAEGSIVDATKGSVSIPVTAVSENEAVTKIAIYANNEKLGEGSGLTYTTLYNTPSKGGASGNLTVTFKAVATLANGEEKEGKPVTMQIKLPVVVSDLEGFSFKMQGSESITSNTIGRKIIMKNTEGEAVDLAALSVRYYFTKEGNVGQTYFCDHASMTFNKAPWYAGLTSDITYKVVNLDTPVNGADTYLELTFEKVGYDLEVGDTLEIEGRLTNTNWSNFDQSNDYSYSNGAVVLYNDAVVSGTMPQ